MNTAIEVTTRNELLTLTGRPGKTLTFFQCISSEQTKEDQQKLTNAKQTEHRERKIRKSSSKSGNTDSSDSLWFPLHVLCERRDAKPPAASLPPSPTCSPSTHASLPSTTSCNVVLPPPVTSQIRAKLIVEKYGDFRIEMFEPCW